MAGTLQIVVAWTEEAQELDAERSKGVRRDLGESYKFKDVIKPFAAMWLNKGTEADVAKAQAYARGEGKHVFVYTGVGDPLGKAKADVLRKVRAKDAELRPVPTKAKDAKFKEGDKVEFGPKGVNQGTVERVEPDGQLRIKALSGRWTQTVGPNWVKKTLAPIPVRGRDAALQLWRYNKITGYWKPVRSVTPETAGTWLSIWRSDEPNEAFKVSADKPTGAPSALAKDSVAKFPRTTAKDTPLAQFQGMAV